MKFIDYPINLSECRSFVYDRDAILNSLKFMLLTGIGSMVYRPNYGLGLNSLLYSNVSDSELESLIKSAIKNSLLDISVKKVEVFSDGGRYKYVNLYLSVLGLDVELKI